MENGRSIIGILADRISSQDERFQLAAQIQEADGVVVFDLVAENTQKFCKDFEINLNFERTNFSRSSEQSFRRSRIGKSSATLLSAAVRLVKFGASVTPSRLWRPQPHTDKCVKCVISSPKTL